MAHYPPGSPASFSSRGTTPSLTYSLSPQSSVYSPLPGSPALHPQSFEADGYSSYFPRKQQPGGAYPEGNYHASSQRPHGSPSVLRPAPGCPPGSIPRALNGANLPDLTYDATRNMSAPGGAELLNYFPPNAPSAEQRGMFQREEREYFSSQAPRHPQAQRSRGGH